MASEPAISIVVATYNRPRALVCAIESARRQTFEDWEMIVVGDHCTDDTESVVRGFDDRRVRFVDLARNLGEQAGPNNIGVALTRAPLVAFLNHDDVWFPWHLDVCRERLLAESADLVYSTAAVIGADSPLPLARSTIEVELLGLGRGGRWQPESPDESAAVASSWLVRRTTLDSLTGWRSARDCIAEASQDLLFRAWRVGFRLRPTNAVTLVVVASGTRTGSYAQDLATEQEWALAEMDRPDFALALTTRALEHVTQAGRRGSGRPSRLRRALYRMFATWGVNPRALEFRLRRRLRRGQYISHLRTVRGLEATDLEAGTVARVRDDELRRVCSIKPGSVIAFSADGAGARHLVSGWSTPDDEGVWNDGTPADLVFDVSKAGSGDLVVELTAEAFAVHGPRLVDVVVDGRRMLTWSVAGDSDSCTFEVAAADVVGSLLRVRLDFHEVESPQSLGLSEDRRRLALRLLTARVGSAEPDMSVKSSDLNPRA